MQKLVNIQILRAVAALAVVFYHVGVEFAHMKQNFCGGCGEEALNGVMGVKLFFMLSGFIMVVTSWNAFGRAGASWDFLKRRFQRIVPIYWLVTTIALVGIILVPGMLNVAVLDPFYVLASYFFWPMARENGLIRPLANLGWTLNLEIMFYVIFAAALYFKRLQGLIFTIAIITLLALGHALGLYGANIQLTFWGDPIILDFALGMVVGAFYKKNTKLSRPALCIFGLGFVALTAMVISLTSWLSTYPEQNLVNRLVISLPCLALFTLGALGPQLNANKPLTRLGLLLGDASYSIYLIHQFALRPYTKIWEKFFSTELPIIVYFVTAPLIAIAIGLTLYYLVEKPVARYFASKRGV